MSKCQKSKIFEHVGKRSFQTKAQGISINTIIIAAIALVVLVVLIAIFSGYMSEWVERFKGVENDCASFTTTIDDVEYSGSWQAECEEGQREIAIATDATDHIGEKCCIAK